MTPFSRHAALSTLLNEAQASAARAMHGVAATPKELQKLAAHVKSAILTQVALGQWCEFGVVDPDDMVGLKVKAKRSTPQEMLLGKPAIQVEYDFLHTARPDICVSQGEPQ